MATADPQTSVMELSIADIHARFAQGLLTCTELTQRLLQRIERYDKQGPCLNAVQLMEQRDATVLRIAIPHLTTLTADLGLSRFAFRRTRPLP